MDFTLAWSGGFELGFDPAILDQVRQFQRRAVADQVVGANHVRVKTSQLDHVVNRVVLNLERLKESVYTGLTSFQTGNRPALSLTFVCHFGLLAPSAPALSCLITTYGSILLPNQFSGYLRDNVNVHCEDALYNRQHKYASRNSPLLCEPSLLREPGFLRNSSFFRESSLFLQPGFFRNSSLFGESGFFS